MTIDFRSALEHAGALQRVTTLRELVEVTHAAVVARTRYAHAWLALIEPHDPDFARVVQFEGASEVGELVFAKCPRVPIVGDPMMEALKAERMAIVVDDARLDPRTNKAIVEQLGNRTLINVPLAMGGEIVGGLGVGTFGEEGVMPPNHDELEWLMVLGMQLAAAYSRLQILEERRAIEQAHLKLERQLESLQRIELMGVLASGVAHDLNNHLTVIQSGVDLVLAGQMDLLEDVRLATERAREVTQQLLTLGRAGSPRREEIDLYSRLTRSVQLVRSSLPRDVRVLIEGGSAAVEADPVQIDQVLANLLLNARDAVTAGGTIRVGVGELTLSADQLARHAWARPGRYGHLWVRDDGCGIAAEHLEHIFDPLFSTKSRGTGLGLAVVSRVVQQHEGLVRCESTLGLGTSFDVYLPAST